MNPHTTDTTPTLLYTQRLTPSSFCLIFHRYKGVLCFHFLLPWKPKHGYVMKIGPERIGTLIPLTRHSRVESRKPLPHKLLLCSVSQLFYFLLCLQTHPGKHTRDVRKSAWLELGMSESLPLMSAAQCSFSFPLHFLVGFTESPAPMFLGS